MPGVSISDILHRDSNNFDLLRLLAAASVIVSHAYVLARGTTGIEPLETVSAFTLGSHAVNVFFILSGLLVAASLDRSSGIVSFATGRALRIVPALAVCVLLTAIVMGPLASTLSSGHYFGSSETYAYIVRTMTLSTAAAPLPGVFGGFPQDGIVNMPLWTLKYEVLSYGALGLLAVLGVWKRGLLLFMAIAGLFALHVLLVPERSVGEHGVVEHMARFFTCFFLGVAAYRLRGHVRLSVAGAVLAALLLVAANGSRFEEIASYVGVGYLALCVAALPVARLRRLTARGDISYGLYIYGWPVAQLVVLAAPGIGPEGLAMASLLLACVPATLSWVLIEQPAMRIRHRLRMPALPRRSASASREPERSVFEDRALDAVQSRLQRGV